MQIDRFSPMILCADVAAARDFYTAFLGLRVNADLGWFVGLELRDGEDVTLELSLCAADHDSVPAPMRETARGLVIAIGSSGVDSVCEDWRARGVEILLEPVSEPWGQRHFYARAPDGVCVDVFEPCPPDPAWMQAHGFS